MIAVARIFPIAERMNIDCARCPEARAGGCPGMARWNTPGAWLWRCRLSWTSLSVTSAIALAAGDAAVAT